MAIGKVNGIDWANVAKVDGIASANIANVTGVQVPTAGASIVTDNLMFDWRAENASGSHIIDNQSSGYNLAMHNGASVTTVGGASSMHTDGVNDRIIVQVPQTYLSSVYWPITMESWQYYSANSNRLGAFVINDAPDVVDWLRQHTDSRSTSNNRTWGQFYTWSGGRYVTALKSNAFSYSGWQHIVTTFEKSGSQNVLKQYVNGTLAVSATSTYGEPFSSTMPWSEGSGNINFSVGCLIRSSPSYYYSDVGEVRFYTDLLTTSEITQNYDARKSHYGL
jgi:hypothetical protein